MTRSNITWPQLANKLKEATESFSKITLAGLLMLLTTSLLEIFYNCIIHEFPQSVVQIILWSCLSDLVFLFTCLFSVYLLFTILFLISNRLAKMLYRVFIVLLLIIQLGLILYFSTALLPLGADVYSYSIADIKQTIGASGILSFTVIVPFVITIAAVVTVFLFLSYKLKLPPQAVIIFPVLSLLLPFTNLSRSINSVNLHSEFSNNLVINKSAYFYSASIAHFFPDKSETGIDAGINSRGTASHKEAIGSFHYVDPEHYPFLHTDSTNDVLSPFFKTTPKPPNIVIILVEGLGRAFSNKEAYLGSFTPFIDSLSTKSLYWKNFLSEGGRTFALLPSLLGSLPFAKSGYLELGENMPAHLSLLSLLKYNGYHTSFYYGGDAHFDNMDIFLHKNKIDELNDGSSFPNGYTKLPADNGFTWGYNDKELFRHYLNSRTSDLLAPQLSVILTVSAHSPFKINEQETYLNRFNNRMTELGFDESKKSNYLNYKYQYASILYMDDALRYFFAAFKKRSDYANTIFVITGDHRMPEIPLRDKIDRYHVPLVIFSPLLKCPSQIAAISTHFDISPSILAYLKHTYKLKVPSLVSWMGQGLDTNVNFRNIHQYPLIQTKTDVLDFVKGAYHLNNNILFKLSPNLDEDPVQDDNQLNELQHLFNQFKKRNSQFTNEGKLIPDSISYHYTRKQGNL